VPQGEALAKSVRNDTREASRKKSARRNMINLNEIKVTPRNEQVLKLIVQGCSNKEIATT
jgi:DNA-binding NarL/FixJ family response regulator